MNATFGYLAASCSKDKVVREARARVLPASGWNGHSSGNGEGKGEDKMEETIPKRVNPLRNSDEICSSVKDPSLPALKTVTTRGEGARERRGNKRAVRRRRL